MHLLMQVRLGVKTSIITFPSIHYIFIKQDQFQAKLILTATKTPREGRLENKKISIGCEKCKAQMEKNKK